MGMEDLSNLPDLIDAIKPSVVQIKTPNGQGTGFFIREDGLLISNKHVVENEVFVKVITHEGKEYDGQVVNGDESADYAFILTNAPILKTLQFADSKEARLGESVFSIGHPYGYDFSISRGIVSSLSRKELKPGLKSVEFIQMDMGINPGNSGGPLVRMNGEVIGMVTMVLMHAHEIAFAVPSKHLIPALNELKPYSKEILADKIYCQLCGASNAAGVKYCAKCGTTIKIIEKPSDFGNILQIKQETTQETGRIKCEACGNQNSSNEKYCGKCGAKLPQTQNSASDSQNNLTAASTNGGKCSTCSFLNEQGVKYCKKCGAKIS